MVHVGVDLDKRSSQIAVLSEDGEIVQHRLANDAARLEKFFADLPPHTPIAIEASGTWWWLVDLLEELGHQPVLSNPKQTKAIAAARLKNHRVDAELVTRWGADARVRRLTTIPGIGPFIAIVLVLELGDIERFASAKRVASYVGLTPRIRGSAGRVRAGHITKEGNRLLRWVLVLAATQAVRRPGPLRAWFHAVKKRRGKKVARVA